MTKVIARSTRQGLLATTLLAGLAISAPAMAQTVQSSGGTAGAPVASTAQAQAVAPAQAPAAASNTVQEVVVTGSILHHNLSDSAAPMTVVTAQDLEVRGITTITDAVQDLAANNGSNLTNAFTANGAFAAGASAASLRGLTTAATLTIIDGLRTNDYPLADDGTRNFVDLNSIPDVIVDRIEVLKDGASSSYGADAVAGVINVITKKTYEGLTFQADDGLTQDGGGGSDHASLLVGYGNLQQDGFNVYLGAEYENDNALYNSQRGPLYNTANLSEFCGVSLAGGETCRANNIQNGTQANGAFNGFGSTNVPLVLPYLNGSAVLNSAAQLLNPAAGCGGLQPTTVIQPASLTGYSGPVTTCLQDNTKMYGMIAPEDTRVSLSIKGTKELPGGAEAYFLGTYYHNDVTSREGPANIQAQDGFAPSTSLITLPVYICPTGAGCNASNGTLNPNNPFAAQGYDAQINYTFGTIPSYNEQIGDSYRFATGVHGHFNLWGDWRYTVDVTAAQTDLENKYVGYLNYAGLTTAINTGAYNFLNPTQNSKAVLNSIAPTDIQNNNSQLGQIKTTLSRDLFQLPGGPLQLGLIGEARYESLYNPSANNQNGGDDRYLAINGTGAIGNRTTQAVAFEFDAPILKQLDIDIAGRYDGYSTGEQGFSPKIDLRWQPIKQFTFRGTLSQGFAAPSLTELYELPTTGFVNAAAPASFLAAHGGDGYGVSYALGETTAGTPSLKAERSDNFTVGIVVTPISQVEFSLDYYYIRIKDAIEPASLTNIGTEALNDYFAGLPLPNGVKVTPGAVDPNYPNALPLPEAIETGYVNAAAQVSTGYDFGAKATYKLPYGVKYNTSFDGNYVLRLETIYPGDTESFAGTAGPFYNVSDSGTPKFRATWMNVLTYGKASIGATVYFTQGYDEEAADFGGIPGLCVQNGAAADYITAVYQDGATPIRCKVAAFWDADLNATYKLTPHIQLFANISNLWNKQAPLDPTTYGSDNYNSSWAQDGIIGRAFKFGAKAVF